MFFATCMNDKVPR